MAHPRDAEAKNIGESRGLVRSVDRNDAVANMTGQIEMNDGPSPDDFRAKLFRDREHTEGWSGRSETCHDVPRRSAGRGKGNRDKIP